MISIVSTYYNRKQQFINTLESIKRSKFKDIEFIVTDDASSDDQRLEDLTTIYPFLKIIRVEQSEKYWVNPCVPFNKAINQATGDIILLQNPECYHKTDILTYISDNMTDGKYISMPVFALTKDDTALLTNGNDVFDISSTSIGMEGGWYNHPTCRPCHYHFCAAIMKSDMNVLKGFDEKYAFGIGFDDDEFLLRVKRMGLDLKFGEHQLVYHQHHSDNWNHLNTRELVVKNQIMFYTLMSTPY